MDSTSRFGLPKPEADDLYDISVYRQALDLLDAMAVMGSGGINAIELITRSAYESLTPKNPATMYVVTDDTETAEEEEESE